MISTCSIEFLVILNYPAITNISVVDRIRGLRYNEDPGITNIFFGTVTLRYSGVSLYYLISNGISLVPTLINHCNHFKYNSELQGNIYIQKSSKKYLKPKSLTNIKLLVR